MKTRFLPKTGSAWLAAVLPLCATLMSSRVLAFDAIGGNANNGSTVVGTTGCQPPAWTEPSGSDALNYLRCRG